MPAPRNFFMTGSASGIGYCIADALVRRGHRVFATDLNLPALQERAGSAQWPPDRVKLCGLDVRNPAAWETVFNNAVLEFGHIDVAMILPGVMRAYWIHETPLEDVELQVDVNIKGIIFGTRTAARHMIAQGAGHIINFGSLAGLVPVPGMAVYSGTKYAVRGFTMAAAYELRPRGVAVTLVCPDGVNTPLFDIPHIHDEEAALVFSGPRFLEPEAVARVILDKVLVRKPMMISIPPYRGRLAQFAEATPRLCRFLLPFLIRKGRAHQQRRLRTG